MFIPFFGLAVLFISDLAKGKRDIDLFKEDRQKSVSVKPINRKKDMNIVPIEEVLLINDNKTKREILFDIFKGNAENYKKELKLALNDPDTETSHYASVALTEIKRKYDNTLIRLKKLIESNPDDLAIKSEYASFLNKYINSGTLDEINKRKFIKVYTEIISEFLDRGDRSIKPELYNMLIEYILQRGNYAKAEEMGFKFLNLFPENEMPYFKLMEVYYRQGEADKLKSIIEKLKNSSVILSKKGLLSLRYFLGKY